MAAIGPGLRAGMVNKRQLNRLVKRAFRSVFCPRSVPQGISKASARLGRPGKRREMAVIALGRKIEIEAKAGDTG